MKNRIIICICIAWNSLLVGQVSSNYSGTVPLTFSSTGNGIYNKSVIYHSEARGFLLELAKITDLISAKPIDFEINARGGTHSFFKINGEKGNVGIGVADPLSKLHVNGGLRITGQPSNFEGPTLLFGATNNPSAEHGNYAIEYIPNKGLNFAIPWPNSGYGNYDLFLSTTRKVGIGTNNPVSKLQVNGDISLPRYNKIKFLETELGGDRAYIKSTNGETIGDYNSLIFATGSGLETMYLKHNGYVGIGTTDPKAKLDVNGNSYIRGLGFSDPSGENGYRIKFYDNGGTHNDVGIGLDGSAAGGEKMWFNSLSGFYWNSGTAGKKMTLTQSGQLGIGTTTPKSSLEVFTDSGNTAKGLVLSQGSDNGNRHSGRLFFTNTGELDNSFTILKNSDKLDFRSNATAGTASGTTRMTISNTGNVGIGTTTPDADAKLTVKGNINAREIKVTATAGGADFVFANDYKLPTLKFVDEFVKKNKHLPEIASAKEMQKEGLLLAEMNIKLLQKIEELTLYTIQQQKEIDTLKSTNDKLIDIQIRLDKLESKD